MLAWLRRWPPHVLNGVSVTIGVGLVQILSGLVAPAFAQAASIGAVLASLPHLNGRALSTLRRTLAGGLLAALATLIVLSTADHPGLRGAAIALISFSAIMGTAWGKPAMPIVFSVNIGMIFALADTPAHGALPLAAAGAAGVLLYSAWACLNAKLLEPRYRELAVFAVLRAAAALLRARAAVLSEAEHEPEEEDRARFGQVSEEARLADALQAARDLVYPAVTRPGAALLAGILSRVAELREILLTSRLDLELLGHDHAARFVRARLALALRTLSTSLEELAVLQRDGDRAASQGFSPVPELPDLFEARALLENDARALPGPAATYGSPRPLR